MAKYTKVDVDDIEDSAPRFLAPGLEALRQATARERDRGRLARVTPGFRVPFGHKHENQEEVYVVLRGSARVKVDDEIVELGELDAIRFDKGTMRAVEAGSEQSDSD